MPFRRVSRHQNPTVRVVRGVRGGFQTLLTPPKSGSDSSDASDAKVGPLERSKVDGSLKKGSRREKHSQASPSPAQEMAFPTMPTEDQIFVKLTEMQSSLLSGNDERFEELQAWVYCLVQSQWFDKLDENLQMDILGAVYFYQLDRRIEAGQNSHYPYFLFYG
jgi:hypothetical protein